MNSLLIEINKIYESPNQGANAYFYLEQKFLVQVLRITILRLKLFPQTNLFYFLITWCKSTSNFLSFFVNMLLCRQHTPDEIVNCREISLGKLIRIVTKNSIRRQTEPFLRFVHINQFCSVHRDISLLSRKILIFFYIFTRLLHSSIFQGWKISSTKCHIGLTVFLKHHQVLHQAVLCPMGHFHNIISLDETEEKQQSIHYCNSPLNCSACIWYVLFFVLFCFKKNHFSIATLENPASLQFSFALCRP